DLGYRDAADGRLHAGPRDPPASAPRTPLRDDALVAERHVQPASVSRGGRGSAARVVRARRVRTRRHGLSRLVGARSAKHASPRVTIARERIALRRRSTAAGRQGRQVLAARRQTFAAFGAFLPPIPAANPHAPSVTARFGRMARSLLVTARNPL